MSESNIIDARGLSCPQPALLARQELQKLGKGKLEVLVDNITARENVSRIGRNLGWGITVDEPSPDNIRIVMEK